MTARYDSPSPEWYEPPDDLDDDDNNEPSIAGTPEDVYGGYEEEWGPDNAQQALERGPR